MASTAFFHSADAKAVLARLVRASAMPASVHYFDRGEESPRIVGEGRCAACAFVAGLRGGAPACRASRAEASARALARGRATSFLCHMGFACVSAPAIAEHDGESGFVLTLGPFCPAEAPQSLAPDALAGLAHIEKQPRREQFPMALDDIRVMPVEAPIALVEWALEGLAEAWRVWVEPEAPAPDRAANTLENGGAKPGGPRPPRATNPSLDRSEGHAAAIAAAVISGDGPRARELIEAALAEAPSTGKKRTARQARALAVAGHVIEAADRAGLDVKACIDRFAPCVGAVQEAKDTADTCAALLRLLAPLKPRRKPAKARTEKASIKEEAGLTEQAGLMERVSQEVNARLPGPVTLEEVAGALAVHPTRITHYLQRKFDVSFTEYVGRLRLEQAKELLRRTRLSVADVARRVGIADPSNLGKLFRRFEGLSPAAYRERFGKDRRRG